MKRKLYVLLASIMFISSCSNENESSISIKESSTSTISNSESSSSIEESSSSVEDTSFIDEAYEDNEDVLLIKDIFEYEEDVDRSLKYNNVFLNRSYSYTGAISSSYPDDEKVKLTDGIKTDLFNYNDWVCFNDTTDDYITFDVSKNIPRVGEIEVHMIQIKSYAIYYPYSVKLEASYDNSRFFNLGEIYTPTDLSENSNYTYKFAFERYCSTPYYRITFTRKDILTQKNRFLFVDEVEAHDYVKDGAINTSEELNHDYYNYNLNTSSITTPVSSKDSDYNTHQNLALLKGVDVQIKSFYGLSKQDILTNTSIDKSSILHDGITTTKLSGDEYFKFGYGTGREVIFDLGNVMAVDSFSFDALSKYNSFIQVPNAYSVELSVDGSNFVSVGGEFTNKLMTKIEKVYSFETTFAKCYKARYVKFSFINDTNLEDLPNKVWISEVKIMGYKNAEGKEEAVYDPSIINGNYVNTKSVGIDNVVFIGVRKNYYFTEENALPYFAYLSQEGEIEDYFFDSLAIGGFSSEYATSSDVKENIKLCSDPLFEDNKNLASIDKVMKTINETMDENRKLKVYLFLNSFSVHDTCGDCDNDGKAEDLSNSDDIADYLLYEVNYLKDKFESKEYENLELAGFYFEKEYLSENQLDKTLPAFREMTDYVRSLNMITFWCPFNGVDTISYWKAAGFDFASYQPNYMFNDVGIDTLDATALEAKINGMCVEIEIENVNNVDLNERYYSYLEYAIKYGHDKSVKMYYQGTAGGGYYNAYKSNYELYEITYKFAKGTLEKDFNEKEKVDIDTFKDVVINVVHDEEVTFNIGDTSKLDVSIKKSFMFGNVQVNLNGDITYKALYGYQGYDTMILTITDSYGNSKDITIKLRVGKE